MGGMVVGTVGAGAGRRKGARTKALWLSGAAAGILALAAADPAAAGPDACSGPNPTVCSGDQSGGAAIGGGTLQVDSSTVVTGTLSSVSSGAFGGHGSNSYYDAAKVKSYEAEPGGPGGPGGAATVVVTDTVIATPGQGVVAGSQGGAGGNGGNGGGVYPSGDNGGAGGSGGAARIDLYGSNVSASYIGLAAYSYGGSGGSGGSSATDVGSPGYAADGGAGGAVTVNTDAASVVDGGDTGIFAWSAGGGGGTGGRRNAGAFNYTARPGAPGGGGGTVTVDNAADITATNFGISAGSLGGQGGAGGGGSEADGGAGATGGAAGAVYISNSGAITSGKFGVYAHSVGGAGGVGGYSSAADADGGRGGNGGNGGQVSVHNEAGGSLTTTGAEGYGVYAVSRGGAGAQGGGAGSVFSAEGADGGGGGGGNLVSVTNDGAIVTQGAGAIGVVAQSIGGVGAGGGSASGIYGGGGDGSAGGGSAKVTVKGGATGSIRTSGDDAFGVLAQSIGGGGGVAGSSSGLVAIGGAGGSGSTGGEVEIDIDNAVTTAGDRAHALFAQSIGGGGGASTQASGVVGIGGSGSTGGDASKASITSGGAIVTGGDDAHGLFAQSIGGGGGTGGASAGLVAIGGSGSAGGAGGQVYADNQGSITTTGDRSVAVFVQSIGGGGGSAAGAGGLVAIGGKGAAGGVGKKAEAHNSGDIDTSGDYAHGLFAQSIGGGGGSGAFAGGRVAIGGEAGAGNTGGEVVLDNSGEIVTRGDGAHAMIGQSIGGGGGAGGGTVSGGPGGSVGIGGKGSGGGDAGVVDIDNTGDIYTLGADSYGVFGQSVGGGGGAGGFAVGGGLFTDVKIGGSAGAGGAGKTVDVDSDGIISTAGDRSHAVFAQSVGGGGGAGGLAASASVGAFGSVSVAVGGAGGGGGAGGRVEVTTAGAVATTGDAAHGLVAQSIGGGGGAGGNAVAASASVGKVSVSIGGGFGGAAGGGGAGDVVDVDNTAQIDTFGDNSYGVLAQSVGGGGGVGGWAGSFAVTGGLGAVSLTASVGGEGGTGGVGGDVFFDNTGDVYTRGQGAHAVVLQSIGGGGGAGGFAVTGNASLGEVSVGVGLSLGGKGGAGGEAGAVLATSHGEIGTEGEYAYGILAQSIGGGGGAGGWSASGGVSLAQTAVQAGIALGGAGGSGGAGDTVTLTTSGLIGTQGIGAIAVLAQSVGGGGGAGGMGLSAQLAAGQTSVALSAALGGTGGTGGKGAVVTLNNTADVGTLGDTAHALVAQSIGGGGGAGGVAGSLTGALGQTGGSFSLGLGGNGGDGGVGDDVTLNNGGRLYTEGDGAYGLLAQSIGGGGGAGGFGLSGAVASGDKAVALAAGLGGCLAPVSGATCAGGTAGTVEVVNDGDIATLGDHSHALVAQSLAGGGGAGGFSAALTGAFGQTSGSAAVSLGGNGGDGGQAGHVDVTNNNFLYTEGEGAYGLLAQSVGGGGGAGGFSVSGAVGAGEKTLALGASLGGCAIDTGPRCAGGAGGEVDVLNYGDVATRGAGAHGVVAQSVGGGGGDGGFSAALGAALSTKTVTAGLSMGGDGGTGGNGAAVELASHGDISTAGVNAIGLLAQSIGGGGGAGGVSVAGALAAGGQQSVSVGVSLGGCFVAAAKDTCGGGDGGAVDVVSTGSIATVGDLAYGVLAQSVGGGGGAGGASGAVAGSLNPDRNVNLGVSLGGFGGQGGEGGDVTVVSDGAYVWTQGAQAHGVFAQSIGGGGGAGGMSMAAAFGNSKAVNLALSMGGFGGAGAISHDVLIDNQSLVLTEGAGAHGLFAQSVAGGGGAGGASGALALSNSDSINLGLGLGGFGGDGSDAGAVEIVNVGDIETLGEGAYAVFAQSIGGGGGQGGMAGVDEQAWGDYLAGGAGAGSFGARNQNITVTLGGYGGAGGDGGAVSVSNDATLVTRGALANVIYAQSVGGGGGDAGVATSASGSFGAGKNGDYAIAIGGCSNLANKFAPTGYTVPNLCEGGDGGDVEVDNDGAIFSFGDGANGVFAQSVGGGGGAGGDARGFAMAFAKKAAGSTKSMQVSLSLGGEGGAAGDGGAVRVANDGSIVTEGAMAAGIYAQSVGGGGGSGGLVSTEGEEIVGILDAVNKGEAKGADISIGGAGGAAGLGGEVTVANTGVIWTKGEQAYGVFAQSVGGGGGHGGSGLAGTLSIGGSGAPGSDGGAVKVTNSGQIFTEGDFATGIYAQSVGGGGGTGGAADYDGEDNYQYRQELADAMQVVGDLQAANDLIASAQAPAFGLSFGGFGGGGGDGGDVTVINTGSIHTKGIGAMGVFAQSVGGGGGAGGQGSITNIGQISFAGWGGGGGDGGDVVVQHTGDIVTEGVGAWGIFAQSVGGGGGFLGDTTLGLGFGELEFTVPSVITSPGGDGGDVTVHSTGNIVVTGIGSMGIFAQSVGGGGGLTGSKIGLGQFGSFGLNGEGGKVVVIHNGDVVAADKNGVAAVLQSVAGADGQDDIVATFNGFLLGGSVYGRGLWLDGGVNNRVDLVEGAAALSGLAVFGTTGDDAVVNHGLVIGNIDLDGGSVRDGGHNTFDNRAGATLQTWTTIDLGAHGQLTNAGDMQFGEDFDPTAVPTAFVTGGVRALAAPAAPASAIAQVTNLTGDFVQSDAGLMRMDVRFGAGASDRLNVTGAASLDGDLHVTLLSLENAGPLTLVATGAGVTDAGLQVRDTLALDYSVRFTATEAQLVVDPHFDRPLTRRNHQVIGAHLNDSVLAGGAAGLGALMAYLGNMQDAAPYREVFHSLSPELYLSPLQAAYFAGEDISDAALSCKTAGVDRAALREDGCVWVRAGLRSLDRVTTAENYGYVDDALTFAAGFQREVSSKWLVGATVGWERHDQRLDDSRGAAKGDLFQLAAAAKRQSGDVTLSGSLAAGAGDFDTVRPVTFPAPGLARADDVGVMFVTAQVRAAKLFEFGSAYAKPLAEFSVTHARLDGFAEQGPAGVSLVMEDASDTVFTVSPAIELGADFGEADGTVTRPWIRAGVNWRPDGGFDVPARFAGTPAGVAPFAVRSELDETTVAVQAGLDLIRRGAFHVTLGYEGEFGEEHVRQGGSVKVGLRF